MFLVLFSAVVNLLLIGIGAYTMFTADSYSNQHIVGLLLVMWGTLGTKGATNENNS